jgi:Domain of unknown function (DUF4377)
MTPTPPIVGGDRDTHGCIGSAGYVWNSQIGQCIRPWMTRTMLFNVKSDTVSCIGVAPMECLQLQKGKNTELFYDTIAGFDFTAGYRYRLLVKRETIENTPTDSNKYQYTLLKVLLKKPVSLVGTHWKIVSLNGKKMNTGTLEFTKNQLSAKFCNGM